MSTRANIIVKSGDEKLIFYRHSDGYPNGALPTINKFIDLIKSKHIRNDVQQGSGWLIFLGAVEYRNYNPDIFSVETPDKVMPKDWKIGSIEPTTGIHGDIQYLYVIDVDDVTVSIYRKEWNGKDMFQPIDPEGISIGEPETITF